MANNSVSQASPYRPPAKATYRCASCNKQYSAAHYLESHQSRSCASTKRGLTQLLGETKAFWEDRKRRRIESLGEVVDDMPCPSGQARSTGGDPGMPERPSHEKRTESLVVTAVPNVQAASEFLDLDEAVAHRKGKRERILPLRYRQDTLPEPLPPVQVTSELVASDSGAIAAGSETTSSNRSLFLYSSMPNAFGVLRKFVLPSPPTHDPDQGATLRDLIGSLSSRSPKTGDADVPSLGPFASTSAFDLAEWYWNSTAKSFLDFQKLVGILKKPGFCLDDAVSVNWKTTFKALGSNATEMPDGEGSWIKDDGWLSTPISIDVPFHARLKDPGIKPYLACSFRHHNLVSVIKEKLTNRSEFSQFHYHPFKAAWRPSGDSPSNDIELYGELYTSRAFREAHEEVQRKASDSYNEGLERVIVALMFWSDSTHLTSFNNAYLWPCYLFFGNDSKYRRCRPSERLGLHVAYFNKLPDQFSDYLKHRNEGKLPTDALFAYCARELFQKQWSVLLDAELASAMQHGMVVVCPDGRRRCFYPRIFTYSVDYPEKVLICGVRNNGGKPCHRCLIDKVDISNLGAPTDTERKNQTRSVVLNEASVTQARKNIQDGYAVDGTNVEAILKPQSLVPTECAFSTRLSAVSFDIFLALVVDVLHEFEAGVWKRLFAHLLRLLDFFSSALGVTLTAELDQRYRKTPSFGRDSIRKFGNNASEMKRRAARDFEDLLQCAIPAFDSLFPEPHNSVLMKLLFICAQWHALAKLRLHHDLSLDLLDYTTTLLGAQMRLFHRDTCSTVQTKESKREADTRARREVASSNRKGSSTRKTATLNIFTIKFHYLGDYSSIIRKFGTTDSYSTETGELYHRVPKAWYPRTDRKDYAVQLSRIERCQARLAQIRSDLNSRQEAQPPHGAQASMGDSLTSPDRRYFIGASQNFPVGMDYFAEPLGRDQDNRYFLNFNSKLKQHLLPIILSKLGIDAGAAGASWENVILQQSRIYSHKLLRIYYTTYDVRREEDVVHINTPQCNVILLNGRYSREAHSRKHPYLYARILGVFHANVAYIGASNPTTFQRIDFVWVHWYDHLGSKDEFSLGRLSLCSLQSTTALDFLDPQDILRGVHLIPQFSREKSNAPRPSFRWSTLKGQDLYQAYYINRFADRDLFMRYQYGLAVGHTYMQTDAFPPATAPIIPNEFDHVLDVTVGVAGEHAEEQCPAEEPYDDEVLDGDGDYFNELEDHELLAYDDMYPQQQDA